MRFLNRIAAAAAVIAVVAACSKENEKENLYPLTETAYSNESLVLEYSNEAMLGKTVTFVPDAADKSKGSVVISGNPYTLDAATLSTSALFGMEKVTLGVEITSIDADSFAFAGNAEVNGFSVECSGEADAASMKLAVNAKMKENALVGSYKLNVEQPMDIIWNCDPITLPPLINDPWPVRDAIFLVMSMIKAVPDPEGTLDKEGNPVKLTVPEALVKALDGVDFYADGNVTATPKVEPVAPTPKNVALVSDVTKDSFKLFLNPFAMDANLPQAQPTSKVVDLNQILVDVQNKAYAKLGEGIEMSYLPDAEKEGVIYVCVNEKALLPILQIVKPIFEDEATINMLKEMVVAMLPEEMANMKPLVEMMLPTFCKQLPNVINTTKELRIGIKLAK